MTFQITVIVSKLSETEKLLGFKHVNNLLINEDSLSKALLRARLSTNFTFKYGKKAKIYRPLNDLINNL